MAVDTTELLAQLRSQSLGLVEALETGGTDCWDEPTRAERWTVRDQMTHLAYFDEITTIAILWPTRFRIEADLLTSGGSDFPDRIAQRYGSMPGDEVLDWFLRARENFTAVAAASDPAARLPWFGPDMSVASTITARLMETWAHGKDVHDTLGTVQPVGAELRSVAHLGIATFGFVHDLHGLATPDARPRIELTGPSGERWTWGAEDAEEIVRGSAEDFASVVTQRRNLADTTLEIQGDITRNWLSIAQAYAGAPGTGRAPLNTTAENPALRGHAS